jgi:hypothetical protein
MMSAVLLSVRTTWQTAVQCVLGQLKRLLTCEVNDEDTHDFFIPVHPW